MCLPSEGTCGSGTWWRQNCVLQPALWLWNLGGAGVLQATGGHLHLRWGVVPWDGNPHPTESTLAGPPPVQLAVWVQWEGLPAHPSHVCEDGARVAGGERSQLSALEEQPQDGLSLPSTLRGSSVTSLQGGE